MKYINATYQLLGCVLLLVFASPSTAQPEGPESWFSFTFDNDIFVGNDNGYTNGATFSRFDVAFGQDKLRKGFLLKPLNWTLSDSTSDFTVRGSSIGQLMNTPSDISISDPPEGELPYAGLLYFTQSYAERFDHEGFADRISTTIGLVGPKSHADSVQKGVHKILGGDEPKGWDTQIKNELVFQFSRARAWQTWRSEKDRVDIVGIAEMNIGTIESSLTGGAFFRVGKGLQESYPSLLFLTSRISNPVSPKGWQLFFGVRGGYVFNQIFLDGNTFRDSRSIEYNPEYIGVTSGYSYSFNNILLTLAVYDLNVLGSRHHDAQKELTQFGALTLAFRL